MATAAYLHAANQPPPLEGYDAAGENRPLVEALRREGAAWAEDRLSELGRQSGGPLLELGRLANEHPPVLRTHDRFGERIDEVEFHPAWHELLAVGVEHGLHALPWLAAGDSPLRGQSPRSHAQPCSSRCPRPRPAWAARSP
jgi:hypothetical protein